MQRKYQFLLLIITILGIITLTSCNKEKKNLAYLEKRIAEVNLPTRTNEMLNLPTSFGGININWTSNSPDIITSDGEILIGLTDTEVTLKGSFSYEGLTINKDYLVTITSGSYPILDAVWDSYEEMIPSTTYKNITFTNDTTNEITTKYSSSNETIINNMGEVTQPLADTTVTISCYITKDGVTKLYQKDILVTAYSDKQKEEENIIYINTALTDLNIPSVTNQKVNLPNSIKEINLTWETTTPLVITSNGEVYANNEINEGILIAHCRYNETVVDFEYVIMVNPITSTPYQDYAWTYYDKALPSKTIQKVNLTKTKYYNCSISYTTSNDDLLDNDGNIHQSLFDQTVILYCHVKSPDGIIKIFNKEVIIGAYTEVQKINMISAWLPTIVNDLNEGRISNLPFTHPEFGGLIVWHSLKEGFISSEGYISKPVDSCDINIQATVSLGTYNSVYKFGLVNYGGESTLEKVFTSWLNGIMPYRLLGSKNTVKDTDEFESQVRTNDKGILNLIDASPIIINKDYLIDITDTSKTIVSKMYGSGTLGTDYHPVTPQATLDAYFGEGYTTPNEKNILWIVVHESGMPKVGNNAELLAKMQYRYAYEGAAREASWHYQVDETGIYQSYDDNVICWHASDGTRIPGNGNNNSIGIEMCINQDGNYEGAMRNDAKLIAYLLDKYNLTIDHVKRHFDFAPDGKKCPNYMIVTNRWEEFLNLVNYEYMALKYLKNSTITWEITTDDETDTQTCLNKYFTYLSHNMWQTKAVTVSTKFYAKLTIVKDNETYVTTSTFTLEPIKKEE